MYYLFPNYSIIGDKGTMHKDIEVNLLEEREDGYHAYCVIFSKGTVEELNKLMRYRKMDSIEDTIESCIQVEIEAMDVNYWEDSHDKYTG